MLNNKKEHYKMYKSGKMWVYSSVVIATLLGGATTVSADTSSNATSNVSSASNASSTATQASTTTSLNSKTTNKAEINAKDTTLVAGPKLVQTQNGPQRITLFRQLIKQVRMFHLRI